jgi:hypothetical protein
VAAHLRLADRLRGPAAPLVALVLGAYAYFHQAGGWNQNSRLDLTRALLDGTVTIDAYHTNTGDKSFRDGRYYCDKAPGMSILGVPVYAAAGVVGVHSLETAAYLVTLFSTGLPVAVSVLLLFLLARALAASPRRAALLALAYGLGTLIFPYATLFYGHDVLAALFLGAFVILARARLAGRVPSFATLVLVGVLLGWAVVVEYPAALGVAVFVAYAASFVPPRRLVALVLGGLGPAVILFLYHTVAFGGPLVLPYSFSTQKNRHLGWFMGIGVPKVHALWGITFSSYRGLFYSAPWLLLAAPGAVLLARSRATRPEAIVCAVVVLLFVWLNGSLVDWDGGWACGPRYLIPAIPFLAVAAAGWPRGRAATAALGILAAFSAYHMLLATSVKPEVPAFAREPLHWLEARFWNGDLSVNTQSMENARAPEGGPHYAWNLGQKLGLDGLASLLPLVVYLAACATWLWRSTAETPAPPVERPAQRKQKRRKSS